MRRRIDTLIKLRVEQQLHRHEAECPMAQMHAQRNILYSPPAVKSQSHQMLVGFMMTYYPDFLKQLTAHTDGRLSDSVIKTKQRLRQKLKGLPADEDLTRWLQLLGEPLDKLPPGHMMFLGEHSAEDKETKIR